VSELNGHGPGEAFAPPRPIAEVGHRDHVTVRGTIVRTEKVVVGGSPAFIAVLADRTGQIDLLFIGRDHVPGFDHHVGCTAQGTARIERSHLVIWNPLYRFEEASEDVPKGGAGS
jgi:hypothetical protein